MAPLMYLSFRRLLVINLLLFLYVSSVSSSHSQTKQFLGRRRMLKIQVDEEKERELQQIQPKKKTSSTSSSSDKTQSNYKSNLPTKNQTKLSKTSLSSSKNQTKLLKSTNTIKTSISPAKSNLKKLNSTSKSLKSSNSTKLTQNSSKKTSDLTKQSSPKNKTTSPTTKPTSTKQTKPSKITEDKTSSNKNSKNTQIKETTTTTQKKKTTQKPIWLDQDDDDTDLVSEFRDLPIRFQQTLIPDLERISTTSKAYINRYNKEFTKNVKPYVGNKYAPTIASFISFAFILIPLLLVSLVVNQIKAYFSLQKILIFIQVYLSIYFSILCLSALVTGLEPLKFFYATSRSTYVGLQVLQTLAYVFYLLMLLMYLILVFSTECGLGSKILGLSQTIVGFAVGLHYYVAVFHRVVLHQPPKTNWKVHGIYATCFLVISLFANAERRKKAYLEEGGEEGKKN